MQRNLVMVAVVLALTAICQGDLREPLKGTFNGNGVLVNDRLGNAIYVERVTDPEAKATCYVATVAGLTAPAISCVKW